MAQWKEKSKRKKIQNVENLRAKKADVSRLACWNDAHSDYLFSSRSHFQPRNQEKKPMTMRIVLSFVVVAALLSIECCHALMSNPVAKRGARTALIPDMAFVRPDTAGMEETALLETAAKMQRVVVPVTDSIHPAGQVGISYVNWPAEGGKRLKLPVVLVHGFDSSCLEYRRLGSRLAARGIDTYAVDLLGWGYTQLDGVSSFSAQANIDSLNSWVETVLGANTPFAIAGASLGGAAAIELAAMNPNCEGLILLDAQGFVDGIGPMASMPRPLAKIGVEVLKSVPLRSSANQMSYFDKKTYATDEAVVVGRMHCMREGWSDALVSFMQSGGFSPSAKVPMVQARSLVLWGREDGILDGKEFAPKFLETLPNASLQWIEECGHVPHLEQPDVTVSFSMSSWSSLYPFASFAYAWSSLYPFVFSSVAYIYLI
jgi:pimeloyl-ACP methyl ester carboxylesterase